MSLPSVFSSARVPSVLQGPVKKVSDLWWMARVARRARLIRPLPLKTLRASGRRAKGWGTAFGGISAANAEMFGTRDAIRDDLGSVTFVEQQDRTNALAWAMKDRGLQPGSTVAIMCRNHRYFIYAAIACAKVGAHTVLLNTEFAGPQLRELLERERPDLLIADEEFIDYLDGVELPTIRAWSDAGSSEVEELIAAFPHDDHPVPQISAEQVILTSGTTGKPKGARRGPARSFDVAASVLDRVPLQVGEVHYIPAPLFHTWGYGNWSLSLVLGATVVLRRRFDTAEALQVLETENPTATMMVPIMAQRIVELLRERNTTPATPKLRAIVLSGSSLPSGFALELMDLFGPVLYVAYGSTEVGAATYADPAQLRQDPGTVGSVLRSAVVAVLDADGNPVPPGTRGMIHVANSWQVEEFTGGDAPETQGNLMATGDFGTMSAEGWLTVHGRGFDMVVSGGENVFPREIEDLLVNHEQIAEAAVIGVPDDEYGERLAAFVLLEPEASLDADAVKAYVRSHLARYKVPREVIFVDELPRNSTGKVLHRVLREEFAKAAAK